jgi:hypothetical protein
MATISSKSLLPGNYMVCVDVTVFFVNKTTMILDFKETIKKQKSKKT